MSKKKIGNYVFVFKVLSNGIYDTKVVCNHG